MTHRIALQNVVQLTHDTRQFIFSRPPEFRFSPGQATDLSLDVEHWRDEKRPFTFTGDPDANVLAFVIKSYPDHDGVTARLADLAPGDHVLIDDPWGAITDRGPGVFLAAGAGITPFIAILSARARAKTLAGCSLHFANRTEADAILRPYWDSLDALDTEYLFEEPTGDASARMMDADYLDKAITDWDQRFYVCGPPKFEEQAIAHLTSRGVPERKIVVEA